MSTSSDDSGDSNPQLQLLVTYDDTLDVFDFRRPAPTLPPGVCWQKGMLFDSGDFEQLEVVRVEVFPNGSVFVVFELEWDSGQEWVNQDLMYEGWKLCNCY